MAIKTSVITNDDGSTGYITNANKYLLSDDYAKKFKLLKALSEKQKEVREVVKAGGIGKNYAQVANKNEANILGFLTKMQKFHHCPPSDNLWVVRIDTMDSMNFTKQSHLPTLYSAIRQANNSWNKMVTTKWKVTLPKGTTTKTINQQYIQQFADNSGMFLAQNVNFTPHSLTINENPFSQGQQHSGFLNFGYIAQNRQINRSLKISFLVSNWDITDILIEPWIAACGQFGLTETSNTSLKAKIIIQQFSASKPKKDKSQEYVKQMECRKQYIFYNCIPVNRGQVQKKYDLNDAGTFKQSVVEFKYEDYEIQYLF